MNSAIIQISSDINDQLIAKLQRMNKAATILQDRLDRLNAVINDNSRMLKLTKDAVKYRRNLPYIEGSIDEAKEMLDPEIQARTETFHVSDKIIEQYLQLCNAILIDQSVAV